MNAPQPDPHHERLITEAIEQLGCAPILQSLISVIRLETARRVAAEQRLHEKIRENPGL